MTNSFSLRPRAKRYGRVLENGRLVLAPDDGITFAIPDPEGQVLALLDLLDGTRTIEAVARELQRWWPPLTVTDVREGVTALAEAGLIEDAAAATLLSARQQERYFSNLAFFSTYATLERSRYSFQEQLLRSHVLILGVGGVGSTLLLNVAGLGVGKITAVDCDVVELRNFARQFLYSESDIGRPKLERALARVHAFNSELELVAVERRITGPEDVAALVRDADLVLAAVDQPEDVRDWINDACVSARVPFITGGFHAGRGAYWSVDPGASGCQRCRQLFAERSGARAPERPERVNRGIGPVASLIGSLIALEALRYLTRFAEPVAAGKVWLADFASGRVEVALEWPRLDDCPLCNRLRRWDRSEARRALAER